MATKSELQKQVDNDKLKAEIKVQSDQLYAIKLVERIVFGLVSIILAGFILALIFLVGWRTK